MEIVGKRASDLNLKAEPLDLFGTGIRPNLSLYEVMMDRFPYCQNPVDKSDNLG